MKNVPAGAHVGDQIEIQGENLDIVSKVCFGDKEASISYQSEREIVATIPFVITDAAPISLYYLDSTGEQFTQPEVLLLRSSKIFRPLTQWQNG